MCYGDPGIAYVSSIPLSVSFLYLFFFLSNVILLYVALVGVCRGGGAIVLRASGYSVCPCFDWQIA
jgi:hypothetical protein